MTTPPNSPAPAVSQAARQALYEIAARCGLVVNEKNPDAIRGSEIIQRAIDTETAPILARATSAEAEVERLKAAVIETETITENEYAMLKQQRDTARAHAIKLREELLSVVNHLEYCLRNKKPVDPRRLIPTVRETLALTADSLGPLAVVSKEELEQLRKDRERLDWLFKARISAPYIRNLGITADQRGAVDATMKEAKAKP